MPGEVTLSYKTVQRIKDSLQLVVTVPMNLETTGVSNEKLWNALFDLYEDLGLETKELIQDSSRSKDGPAGTKMSWIDFLTKRVGIYSKKGSFFGSKDPTQEKDPVQKRWEEIKERSQGAVAIIPPTKIVKTSEE